MIFLFFLGFLGRKPKKSCFFFAAGASEAYKNVMAEVADVPAELIDATRAGSGTAAVGRCFFCFVDYESISQPFFFSNKSFPGYRLCT